jgi:hypothetical protein
MWVLAFGQLHPNGAHIPVYNGDRVDLAEQALEAAARAGKIRLGRVYKELSGGHRLTRVRRIDYSHFAAAEVTQPPVDPQPPVAPRRSSKALARAED